METRSRGCRRFTTSDGLSISDDHEVVDPVEGCRDPLNSVTGEKGKVGIDPNPLPADID